VGNAIATSGSTFGVQGISASASGIGIQANNSSTGEVVALGAPSPYLINAFINKTGIFTVDNSGNGFFAGNLHITGKRTKGGGSFKIDRPLDPANKYLSHSFVESPDMMNVDNGKHHDGSPRPCDGEFAGLLRGAQWGFPISADGDWAVRAGHRGQEDLCQPVCDSNE